MATRNYVPRANGEGSIGTEKKHWGGAFFDKLSVKTLEVIGVGTENDAQPATVGWVKQGFAKLLKSALENTGMRYNIEANGYICFGSLLGNLTLQWGFHDIVSGWDSDSEGAFVDLPYNIDMKDTYVYPICVHGSTSASDFMQVVPERTFVSKGVIRLRRHQLVGSNLVGTFYWLVLGRI